MVGQVIINDDMREAALLLARKYSGFNNALLGPEVLKQAIGLPGYDELLRASASKIISLQDILLAKAKSVNAHLFTSEGKAGHIISGWNSEELLHKLNQLVADIAKEHGLTTPPNNAYFDIGRAR